MLSPPLGFPRMSGSRPIRGWILIPLRQPRPLSSRRLSGIFVSFAILRRIPVRMKKSVQISRIVSEIHINETRWLFAPSGNALPGLSHVNSSPLSSVTHKEDDSVLYSFVAVISPAKQVVNILNIYFMERINIASERENFFLGVGLAEEERRRRRG